MGNIRNVKKGQVYFGDLDPVVGVEQGAQRPVVVLQNNKTNRTSKSVLVAPMSSSKNVSMQKTYVTIISDCLKNKTIIKLEHIRSIDKCRLKNHIAEMDEGQMKEIDYTIRTCFGLHYLIRISDEYENYDV